MELQEKNNSSKTEDVLGEEVNETVQVEPAQKNMNDFAIDSFDLPGEKKEEKKTDEPVATEKIKTTETTTTKAPDGSTQTQTRTVESTEQRNEVVARTFKPVGLFIMWDIVASKVGRAFAKETPPEHWKLDKADKDDLGYLMTETAREGNFSGVPTKILLLIALGIIIFVKIKTRKDPVYNLASNNSPGQKTLEETAAEMKLQEQNKAMFVKYEDLIAKLQEQNEKLMKLIEGINFNKGSAYYEEINPEQIKRAEASVASQVKSILKSELKPGETTFEGYDLEKIRFTVNGGFVEREKAGEKGYNKKGVKIGTPSAIMKKVFEQWEIYHQNKSGEAPYFVA